MPTKKAPRKETGRLPKKSSVTTLVAAAKKDPAKPPTPPKKKGSNSEAPSSTLRNQRYASRIQKNSSNPTSISTEAIAGRISSPPPFQQVVTRLWSKGAVVKQIGTVQDVSANKRPPQHIMGLGLRKPPPELNSAAVITTKSPTNSVAAAASTLIYQKNYDVDSFYEDSDAYESDANGSKDDESDANDGSKEDESGAASGAKVDERFAPAGLVYSDDEAYLFEVESSDDEFRTSFPKDLVRKNIIQGGPTKPDVTNMSEAEAKIVLKAYAKERKAYTDKQRLARVKAVQSISLCLSGYSGHNHEQLRTMTDVELNR